MAKNNTTRKESAPPDPASPAINQTFAERLLTVTTFCASAPAGGRYPWLQLRGHWMAKAGFPVGTKVRVRVMTDCLVLTKVDPVVVVDAEKFEVAAKRFKKAIADQAFEAVMAYQDTTL